MYTKEPPVTKSNVLTIYIKILLEEAVGGTSTEQSLKFLESSFTEYIVVAEGNHLQSFLPAVQ